MTRKIPIATLAALVVLALGAFAVRAAITKPDFGLTVSPSSQTVTRGNSTSFNVMITRSGGFTGSVTLSAAGLPAGATASWKLSNGTSSNIVPSTLSSATLTVSTSSSAQAGTFNLQIAGTSGSLSHSTSYTLVVQPPVQPNFTMSSLATAQTIPQSDSATYPVSLTRSGGFTGAVALSVSGLPKQATATFTPTAFSGATTNSNLVVDTPDNVDTGTFQVTITGTGSIGTRTAVVTLIIQKKQNFLISGDASGVVGPGVKTPVDLTLSNPNNYDLQITNISLAIEGGTSITACSGTTNFKPVQIPSSAYPIRLPANATRKLSQLGVAAANMPKVEMLDLGNQDVCKGAGLHLNYQGAATK